MPNVKPVHWKDLPAMKGEQIPDAVFEVFNQLIAKGWDGRQAVVKQNEVQAMICAKLRITAARLYQQKWMDVEEVYRAAGWKVEFDQPAYNESYPATYTFKKPATRG